MKASVSTSGTSTENIVDHPPNVDGEAQHIEKSTPGKGEGPAIGTPRDASDHKSAEAGFVDVSHDSTNITNITLSTNDATDIPRSIEVKRFVISTNVDDAQKYLNRRTTIVFTLTPAIEHPSSTTEWDIVIWKVLSFEAKSRKRQALTWTDEAGFCTLKAQEDGTVKFRFGTPIPLQHIAVLSDEDGHDEFSEPFPAKLKTGHVGLLIEIEDGARIALFVTDTTREEADQFCPVVVKRFEEKQSLFLSGIPVMLQAHVVSGLKERQLVTDPQKLGRPLFVDKENKPHPIDVRILEHTTVFRLYTNMRGDVILEK